LQVRYDNGVIGWSAENYLRAEGTVFTPTAPTLSDVERNALIIQIQQKIVELTKLLIAKILAGER
jgi:hypothetical protein